MLILFLGSLDRFRKKPLRQILQMVRPMSWIEWLEHASAHLDEAHQKLYQVVSSNPSPSIFCFNSQLLTCPVFLTFLGTTLTHVPCWGQQWNPQGAPHSSNKENMPISNSWSSTNQASSCTTFHMILVRAPNHKINKSRVWPTLGNFPEKKGSCQFAMGPKRTLIRQMTSPDCPQGFTSCWSMDRDPQTPILTFSFSARSKEMLRDLQFY